MRYRKPVVMELNGRARRANGSPALGCVSGPSAGAYESCGSGGTADWGCATGGAADPIFTCFGGTAADAGGDCLGGSVVQYYCEVGTSGSNDPYGCVAGPSFS